MIGRERRDARRRNHAHRRRWIAETIDALSIVLLLLLIVVALPLLVGVR